MSPALRKLHLLPRSLFGRLALLVIGSIVVSVVVTLALLREDRARLVANHFTESRLAQIEALRDLLRAWPEIGTERASAAPAAAAAPSAPWAGWHLLQRRAREFGFVLVPVERRPEIGAAPRGGGFQRLRARLAERLGSDVEVRLGMRLDQPVAWLRLPVGRDGAREVWVGVPIPHGDPLALPQRLVLAVLGVVATLLVLAWWFTRRLTRPLAELSRAVEAVASGQQPAPLPETGPREIAEVARHVNRMTRALERLEANRRVMLAGISHDLRTPLARVRLATELAVASPEERRAIVADLDAIERVLGQFLELARGKPETPPEPIDVRLAVEAIIEPLRAAGRPVSLQAPPEALPALLYPAAFERMLLNLIENAERHGAPPVEVALRRHGETLEIDVLDRGPGIDPARVEELRAPFVRGDAARSDAPGAGLGLAIVDRLAQWHGGRLELLPRSGGGTVARLILPLNQSRWPNG
ncbi:MAG: ATP-binding protein [Casimicrobiaceae bacterium]|nr:ATP-binding protein [Casimicrobiaceae bacterium]